MDDRTAESLQTFQQALLNPLTALWNQFVALLPHLMAAVFLVVIGYFLAKFLGFLASKVLKKLGLDRLSQSTGLEQVAAESGIEVSVSAILGQIVFWLVMLTFLLSAASALGLPRLSETINEVVLYIPKIIGAVFVGLIGLFAAHAARKTVQAAGQRGGLVYAKQLSGFLYVLLLIVTFSLAFSQLELEVGLLNQLLTIAALTIGVAIALSLGMGTRDIVENIISGYYARDIHHPGTHIECGAISGELIVIGTTKTLIQVNEDTTVAVSNRQLLDQTTATSKAA